MSTVQSTHEKISSSLTVYRTFIINIIILYYHILSICTMLKYSMFMIQYSDQTKSNSWWISLRTWIPVMATVFFFTLLSSGKPPEPEPEPVPEPVPVPEPGPLLVQMILCRSDAVDQSVSARSVRWWWFWNALDAPPPDHHDSDRPRLIHRHGLLSESVIRRRFDLATSVPSVGRQAATTPTESSTKDHIPA